MKTFIESQVGNCSLVCMFHVRKVNRKINHLHESSLRIVYKDYTSSFGDLLRQDISVIVHHRNIQSLAIELFKVNQFQANVPFLYP